MILLSITDLHFEFRPGNPILNGVCLTLESEQALVLSGSNGSGKTTLLNIIAGALRPTGGQVSLAGHRAHTTAGRRARWHMTSSPALFRLLTVAEQLDFYSSAHGLDTAQALSIVRELIAEDVSDKLCAQLSTGQAQKVWFAATLATHSAPILLLDEPFSAIDAESVPLMVDLLDQERRAGRTLVLVTHTHRELLPKTWIEKDISSLSGHRAG